MSPRRRFLAILAAYALALSAVLSGFAFAGPPADAGLVICGPGGAGPAPAAPARSHPCCPSDGICAMPACGAATVLGRAPGLAMPAEIVIGLLPPPPVVGPRVLTRHGGQRARGPPLG